MFMMAAWIDCDARLSVAGIVSILAVLVYFPFWVLQLPQKFFAYVPARQDVGRSLPLIFRSSW